MKRNLFFFWVVIFCCFGCEFEKAMEKPALEELFLPKTHLSKSEAMTLAQDEVLSFANGEKPYVWNHESKVVDAYEIHLDGVEGVSYYECKVETNGKSTGYILVNVNDTDFPIVEACEEGLTLNEEYEKITSLPKEEFDVYRYGYLESVAFQKNDKVNLNSLGNKPLEKGKLLASKGFPNVASFDFEGYQKAVKENKGSLFSQRTNISSKQMVARGMTGKGNAEVYLNYKWKTNGLATPPWRQLYINYKTSEIYQEPNVQGPDIAAIGCGPVALAINLAYWQQKKGKSGLFDSSDLLSKKPYEVKENFKDIWKTVKTSKALNLGYTPTCNMVLIKDYINRRGYSCTVERKNGTYDPKFNMIYDCLAEDRPVIMLIKAEGIGIPDHYVVIQHAVRKSAIGQSSIRYCCNYGWGYVLKWVYAFSEKAVYWNKETPFAPQRCSTYDIWDIKID